MGFVETVALFLDACPGPPLARTGLGMAALQSVEGIPGLQTQRTHGVDTRAGLNTGNENLVGGARHVPYLSSVAGVAKRLRCRPAYLSRASTRHGYSFSRALRWIRLLHGMALRAEGFRVDTVALRLGFSDVSGWSRFTKRLIGRPSGSIHCTASAHAHLCPGRMTLHRLVPWVIWCVPLLATAACVTDYPAVFEAVKPWTTQADVSIGEIHAGDAAFATVTQVRTTWDGTKVFVLEPYEARVTVWTPDGRLLADVGGRGEGPGEFIVPYRVHIDAEGFYVRDQRRFTLFEPGGGLLGTVPDPPPALSFRGFRLRAEALLEDDSFLAVPVIPPSVAAGWRGDDAIDSVPVLHVRHGPRSWIMDTVVVLNTANARLSVRPSGGQSGFQGFHSGQPFGDHDLTYYDPANGSVVVLRRSTGDGSVEVAELAADGDVTWQRRLILEPVPLVQSRAEELIGTLTRVVSGDAATGPRQMSGEAARPMVEEALYLPNPLPGASHMVGTSAGEVWLETFERIDTLTAWYAIRRGNSSSPVRRVLLPTGFALHDATSTHVWGVRRDSLGVNYVERRQLIAGQE